ncbi:hypothetical protein PVAND_017333 [Polypedilum vanderplanki]|uniref:Uncharacterized protein n=1 Tax=Polypedilum vanderplanki TaxID=319348 RepID=A0A9J6BJ58_POLVA|nr:hypothetical protein PVAND_017333 [Polypedilum vanderplanki]
MIDIELIVKCIDEKIEELEKLEFNEPEEFLCTPLTAVPVNSNSDFAALASQVFHPEDFRKRKQKIQNDGSSRKKFKSEKIDIREKLAREEILRKKKFTIYENSSPSNATKSDAKNVKNLKSPETVERQIHRNEIIEEPLQIFHPKPSTSKSFDDKFLQKESKVTQHQDNNRKLIKNKQNEESLLVDEISSSSESDSSKNFQNKIKKQSFMSKNLSETSSKCLPSTSSSISLKSSRDDKFSTKSTKDGKISGKSTETSKMEQELRILSKSTLKDDKNSSNSNEKAETFVNLLEIDKNSTNTTEKEGNLQNINEETEISKKFVNRAKNSKNFDKKKENCTKLFENTENCQAQLEKKKMTKNTKSEDESFQKSTQSNKTTKSTNADKISQLSSTKPKILSQTTTESKNLQTFNTKTEVSSQSTSIDEDSDFETKISSSLIRKDKKFHEKAEKSLNKKTKSKYPKIPNKNLGDSNKNLNKILEPERKDSNVVNKNLKKPEEKQEISTKPSTVSKNLKMKSEISLKTTKSSKTLKQTSEKSDISSSSIKSKESSEKSSFSAKSNKSSKTSDEISTSLIDTSLNFTENSSTSSSFNLKKTQLDGKATDLSTLSTSEKTLLNFSSIDSEIDREIKDDKNESKKEEILSKIDEKPSKAEEKLSQDEENFAKIDESLTETNEESSKNESLSQNVESLSKTNKSLLETEESLTKNEESLLKIDASLMKNDGNSSEIKKSLIETDENLANNEESLIKNDKSLSETDQNPSLNQSVPQKRKRGRPPKIKSEQTEINKNILDSPKTDQEISIIEQNSSVKEDSSLKIEQTPSTSETHMTGVKKSTRIRKKTYKLLNLDESIENDSEVSQSSFFKGSKFDEKTPKLEKASKSDKKIEKSEEKLEKSKEKIEKLEEKKEVKIETIQNEETLTSPTVIKRKRGRPSLKQKLEEQEKMKLNSSKTNETQKENFQNSSLNQSSENDRNQKESKLQTTKNNENTEGNSQNSSENDKKISQKVNENEESFSLNEGKTSQEKSNNDEASKTSEKPAPKKRGRKPKNRKKIEETQEKIQEIQDKEDEKDLQSLKQDKIENPENEKQVQEKIDEIKTNKNDQEKEDEKKSVDNIKNSTKNDQKFSEQQEENLKSSKNENLPKSTEDEKNFKEASEKLNEINFECHSSKIPEKNDEDFLEMSKESKTNFQSDSIKGFENINDSSAKNQKHDENFQKSSSTSPQKSPTKEEQKRNRKQTFPALINFPNDKTTETPSTSSTSPLKIESNLYKSRQLLRTSLLRHSVCSENNLKNLKKTQVQKLFEESDVNLVKEEANKVEDLEKSKEFEIDDENDKKFEKNESDEKKLEDKPIKDSSETSSKKISENQEILNQPQSAPVKQKRPYHRRTLSSFGIDQIKRSSRIAKPKESYKEFLAELNLQSKEKEKEGKNQEKIDESLRNEKNSEEVKEKLKSDEKSQNLKEFEIEEEKISKIESKIQGKAEKKLKSEKISKFEEKSVENSTFKKIENSKTAKNVNIKEQTSDDKINQDSLKTDDDEKFQSELKTKNEEKTQNSSKIDIDDTKQNLSKYDDDKTIQIDLESENQEKIENFNNESKSSKNEAATNQEEKKSDQEIQPKNSKNDSKSEMQPKKSVPKNPSLMKITKFQKPILSPQKNLTLNRAIKKIIPPRRHSIAVSHQIIKKLSPIKINIVNIPNKGYSVVQSVTVDSKKVNEGKKNIEESTFLKGKDSENDSKIETNSNSAASKNKIDTNNVCEKQKIESSKIAVNLSSHEDVKSTKSNDILKNESPSFIKKSSSSIEHFKSSSSTEDLQAKFSHKSPIKAQSQVKNPLKIVITKDNAIWKKIVSAKSNENLKIKEKSSITNDEKKLKETREKIAAINSEKAKLTKGEKILNLSSDEKSKIDQKSSGKLKLLESLEKSSKLFEFKLEMNGNQAKKLQGENLDTEKTESSQVEQIQTEKLEKELQMTASNKKNQEKSKIEVFPKKTKNTFEKLPKLSTIQSSEEIIQSLMKAKKSSSESPAKEKNNEKIPINLLNSKKTFDPKRRLSLDLEKFTGSSMNSQKTNLKMLNLASSSLSSAINSSDTKNLQQTNLTATKKSPGSDRNQQDKNSNLTFDTNTNLSTLNSSLNTENQQISNSNHKTNKNSKSPSKIKEKSMLVMKEIEKLRNSLKSQEQKTSSSQESSDGKILQINSTLIKPVEKAQENSSKVVKIPNKNSILKTSTSQTYKIINISKDGIALKVPVKVSSLSPQSSNLETKNEKSSKESSKSSSIEDFMEQIHYESPKKLQRSMSSPRNLQFNSNGLKIKGQVKLSTGSNSLKDSETSNSSEASHQKKISAIIPGINGNSSNYRNKNESSSKSQDSVKKLTSSPSKSGIIKSPSQAISLKVSEEKSPDSEPKNKNIENLEEKLSVSETKIINSRNFEDISGILKTKKVKFGESSKILQGKDSNYASAERKVVNLENTEQKCLNFGKSEGKILNLESIKLKASSPESKTSTSKNSQVKFSTLQAKAIPERSLKDKVVSPKVLNFQLNKSIKKFDSSPIILNFKNAEQLSMAKSAAENKKLSEEKIKSFPSMELNKFESEESKISIDTQNASDINKLRLMNSLKLIERRLSISHPDLSVVKVLKKNENSDKIDKSESLSNSKQSSSNFKKSKPSNKEILKKNAAIEIPLENLQEMFKSSSESDEKFLENSLKNSQSSVNLQNLSNLKSLLSSPKQQDDLTRNRQRSANNLGEKSSQESPKKTSQILQGIDFEKSSILSQNKQEISPKTLQKTRETLIKISPASLQKSQIIQRKNLQKSLESFQDDSQKLLTNSQGKNSSKFTEILTKVSQKSLQNLQQSPMGKLRKFQKSPSNTLQKSEESLIRKLLHKSPESPKRNFENFPETSTKIVQKSPENLTKSQNLTENLLISYETSSNSSQNSSQSPQKSNLQQALENSLGTLKTLSKNSNIFLQKSSKIKIDGDEILKTAKRSVLLYKTQKFRNDVKKFSRIHQRRNSVAMPTNVKNVKKLVPMIKIQNSDEVEQPKFQEKEIDKQVVFVVEKDPKIIKFDGNQKPKNIPSSKFIKKRRVVDELYEKYNKLKESGKIPKLEESKRNTKEKNNKIEEEFAENAKKLLPYKPTESPIKISSENLQKINEKSKVFNERRKRRRNNKNFSTESKILRKNEITEAAEKIEVTSSRIIQSSQKIESIRKSTESSSTEMSLKMKQKIRNNSGTFDDQLNYDSSSSISLAEVSFQFKKVMKSLLYLLLIQFYFIFAQQNPVLVSNSQAADNSNNKYANCLLAKDPGPCKGMVPRFYYDSSLKKCGW